VWPPLRILVADDVAQNLELLATVLRRDGHTTHCVADGAEALAAVQAQRYDLVLMDVHMPVLDGLAATRAIREHERASGSAAVPVIALTASVLAEDRAAATEAGMNGFASKPVELPVLYAEMARVLGIAEASPAAARSPGAIANGAINWRRGLGLWGDRERLHDAIARFLDQELPRSGVADPDQAPDWAARRTRAHTLRGTAGNLALDGVARAAGHLESAARDADADAYRAAQAALRDELHRSAAALEVGASAADAWQPAAPGGDPAHLQALIGKAEQALARGELAEQPLAELAKALPAARLAAVQQAIAEFDTAAATRALHALRDTLPGVPAEPSR
jgi:two-component system, sensor histidine kinase and response regulator